MSNSPKLLISGIEAVYHAFNVTFIVSEHINVAFRHISGHDAFVLPLTSQGTSQV